MLYLIFTLHFVRSFVRSIWRESPSRMISYATHYCTHKRFVCDLVLTFPITYRQRRSHSRRLLLILNTFMEISREIVPEDSERSHVWEEWIKYSTTYHATSEASTCCAQTENENKSKIFRQFFCCWGNRISVNANVCRACACVHEDVEEKKKMEWKCTTRHNWIHCDLNNGNSEYVYDVLFL